ncbi:MAG TPA: hypothetical protein PKB11_02115 [Desulfovibrio sp.]|uniref:UshA-like (seleno)protein family 2 n=1 Tax=Desulfovibrio sp. TaxID=885 RepID=UPI002B76AA12|nr:hypothetical protein [Desulfovibrio sp.]HMM37528.1 hypothetical protein [Desulfovibrio sp.]
MPLSRAYALLGYDLGVASSQEAAWLQANRAPLPPGWTICSGKPQERILDTKDGKVGVLLLPCPAKGGAALDPEQLDALRRSIRSMRERTRLVIGVSPWGYTTEMGFLRDEPGMFDILLGTGNGPGLQVAFSPDSRTLWIRSYTKGQAPNIIEVVRWPSGKPDWQWKAGDSIRAGVIGLGDNIAGDEEMSAIFANAISARNDDDIK